MREICFECDKEMRLLKPNSSDPDVLIWVCDNRECPFCTSGSWLIAPNWGKLFPTLGLTEAMIEQLSSPAS